MDDLDVFEFESDDSGPRPPKSASKAPGRKPTPLAAPAPFLPSALPRSPAGALSSSPARPAKRARSPAASARATRPAVKPAAKPRAKRSRARPDDSGSDEGDSEDDASPGVEVISADDEGSAFGSDSDVAADEDEEEESDDDDSATRQKGGAARRRSALGASRAGATLPARKAGKPAPASAAPKRRPSGPASSAGGDKAAASGAQSPSSTSADGPPSQAKAKAKPASRRGVLPDRLPVVIPPSLLSRPAAKHCSALVHMSGGEVDLEGDVGAIGRLTAASDGILLDLQGQRFAGAIVPCCTHLVLALGPSEAKVEVLSSDAVLLRHVSSAFDQMGASLVSGHEVETLLAFEDVEHAGRAGAGAEGDAGAEAGDEAGQAKGAAKARGKGKGKRHEFFGTRRTSTAKGKSKRKAKK